MGVLFLIQLWKNILSVSSRNVKLHQSTGEENSACENLNAIPDGQVSEHKDQGHDMTYEPVPFASEAQRN